VPLADVVSEREGAIAIATVSGEVDMSNAASIRMRIAELVSPADVALVIDLSPLAFIDSAGLHAIAELAAVLGERRQRLLLCIPDGSQVRRAIETIGIPHAVAMHPDRDAAIGDARTSAMPTRPYPPEAT
jgi:anti-sigma B factor antagonist